MKILLEDTIPFGRNYLDDVGDVTTYAWQSLKPEDLQHTNILALRSTTKVTPELLANAKHLSFVTTATAGTNHLDKDYLSNANIGFNSAAGCNAVAVAEYVLSAMLHAHVAGKVDLNTATVGIVGAGNVGSALSRILSVLNIKHLLCDPPLDEAGDSRRFSTLNEIANCDVISLHVPYVKAGAHPTGHLIDQDFLAALSSKQILINACRGEVINESALLARLKQDNAPTVVLDVFDNEPNIDTHLFDYAWFVTPHIAGHSVEGKVRGTQMIYEQICEVVGAKATKSLDDFLESTSPISAELNFAQSGKLVFEDLAKVFHQVYDISIDDQHTRRAMTQSDSEALHNKSAIFASLRKQYRVRRECSAYRLMLPRDTSKNIQNTFSALGFNVQLG